MQLINGSFPVNIAHPINRGLKSWWLNLPGGQFGGGLTWRDLLRRNDMPFENNMASDSWLGSFSRPGGWGSIDFDGTDDGMGSLDTIPTYPWTLSGWVRPNDVTAQGLVLGIFVNADNSDNFHRLWWSNPGILRATSFVSPTARHAFSADNLLVNGVWSHIAGVWASDTSRKVYHNGLLIDSNTDSSAPTGMDELRIGVSNAGTQDLDGQMDDLRYYTYELTDADVMALYKESSFGYPNGLNRRRSMVVAGSVAPPTNINTPEKRYNISGVGRPYKRIQFPQSTPDEEWRMAIGSAYSGNALDAAPVGGPTVGSLALVGAGI